MTKDRLARKRLETVQGELSELRDTLDEFRDDLILAELESARIALGYAHTLLRSRELIQDKPPVPEAVKAKAANARFEH